MNVAARVCASFYCLFMGVWMWWAVYAINSFPSIGHEPLVMSMIGVIVSIIGALFGAGLLVAAVAIWNTKE
jgi:hypothetical protein